MKVAVLGGEQNDGERTMHCKLWDRMAGASLGPKKAGPTELIKADVPAQMLKENNVSPKALSGSGAQSECEQRDDQAAQAPWGGWWSDQEWVTEREVT